MNKEPINEIARQVVSRILEDAVFRYGHIPDSIFYLKKVPALKY